MFPSRGRLGTYKKRARANVQKGDEGVSLPRERKRSSDNVDDVAGESKKQRVDTQSRDAGLSEQPCED